MLSGVAVVSSGAAVVDIFGAGICAEATSGVDTCVAVTSASSTPVTVF